MLSARAEKFSLISSATAGVPASNWCGISTSAASTVELAVSPINATSFCFVLIVISFLCSRRQSIRALLPNGTVPIAAVPHEPRQNHGEHELEDRKSVV